MSLTEKWYRNSFGVDAVRVTRENMPQVAEWCGGTIHRNQSNQQFYIALEKTEYGKVRIARACVGDWVLLTNGIFKNYRNEKFLKSFNRPVRKELELAHKRGRVIAVLVEVLATKNQTYDEDVKTAYENADKIMSIFGDDE